MKFLNFGNAINKYRRERWCYLHGLKPLAYLIRNYIYLIHNSYIPPSCEIGEGSIFAYKGMGCVIHARAVIGENCLIGTNVTIGGRSGHYEVPVIGNNVEISTGAKVLGPIRIGDNAIIGANAVVITDVPAGEIWGGVPAKFIRKTYDI